jgi:hypothetical protein
MRLNKQQITRDRTNRRPTVHSHTIFPLSLSSASLAIAISHQPNHTMPSPSPTLRFPNSSSSSLSFGTRNAAGSVAPALRSYLRKPSRKALYVQPPHWLPDHLSIFRLELVDHPDMPPPMSHVSLSHPCDARLEDKRAAQKKLVEKVLANPWPCLSRQANLDRADEVLSRFLYWTVHYSFTPSLGQALVIKTARFVICPLPPCSDARVIRSLD